MNNALLQGTIATQPELNSTQDGSKQYTRFSLSFPGQKPEDPADTMNAIAWGALAETIATYSSGLEIVIEGRIDIKKPQEQGTDPVVTFVANRVHLISATTPMPAQASAPAQATPIAAQAKAPVAQAKTPVTPVAAMTGASVGRSKAEVVAAAPEGYEPDYSDIPF